MISGERVTLRAPEARDMALLARLRSDEELQRLLAARARGSSPERTRAWIDKVQSDAASLLFVIADGDDATAGYLQIVNIDSVSRHAEFGICVAPAFQGRGLGSEALSLVEQYLARVWNLRKLTLHVLSKNEAAINVYRRIGFTEAGVLREHFWFAGEFEDVMIMEHVFA